ncbi:DUF3035 domain-containing protein [Phaeobacter gallaeciensis]|uniref:DUF3035 domain-containing protein n=2 Tax=Roseobacteraceae TaxID=2854170 RepID=A0A366X3X9_9RHOB|nr:MULTISPECIES: DUF3035 domain-containing protein [Roseobacteraceae]MBT3141843.1 DUF3035 domain-containing protein [Falsiruegeria litorea]MBT8168810.1 DUF3035 domain-containing protein [Falsiruegeria litorea]RBW59942.1 DUF3035 domain-containing protein [Phaeobacter gallaeciensis]
MRTPLGIMIVAAALAVSGCSNKGLRDIRAPGPGPDEFSVLPSKPLTAPRDYAVLPAPTPGGVNLVDPNPVAEAAVALGGRGSAYDGNAVPSSDAALVTASSRYGVPSNTRQALEQEDAEFRKKQGRMTRIRLFPVDRYKQVYKKQTLNASQQADGYRRAGVPTPAAPPTTRQKD